MRETKEHKNKGREILKVLGISLLAIGLASAAFIGINSLAFDTSTGAVESLPPVAGAVVVPAANEPPEGFVEPEITVVAPEPYLSVDVQDTEIAVNPHQELGLIVTVQDSQNVPGPNAISPHDAALIGAQYIWQMFGEWIDGKYLSLLYSSHPSQTRTYWMGSVTEVSQEQVSRDMDDRERINQIRAAVLFSFTIDAVTGEWIDISGPIGGVISDEVMAVLEEMRQSSNQGEFYEVRRGGMELPVELDRQTQIAKEHASRHFVHSEVVSVEFRDFAASNFELDENGNLVTTARQLFFEATDSTGRVADLSFDEATGRLFYLMTMHNDFVPGFRYDMPGANEQGLG